MPLIKICTPQISGEERSVILSESSRILSEIAGKPESSIMGFWQVGEFIMAGKECAGAYVEIRGIGKIEPALNAEASKKLCALIAQQTDIPEKNIYLNFVDMPAGNWGTCNGPVG